jgi:hypothetical protein
MKQYHTKTTSKVTWLMWDNLLCDFVDPCSNPDSALPFFCLGTYISAGVATVIC